MRPNGYAPDAVMGHSVGEYVAACVAGVFSLEDGLRLIAARAALMQSLPAGGEMASVFAGEDIVQPVVRDLSAHLAIAAFNTPTQTVLSGDAKAMRIALQRLQEQGVSTRKLTVSHAFHSPLMHPIVEPFQEVLDEIRFGPPQIPLLSNVTGKAIEQDVDWPAYWIRHLLQPVRFVDCLHTLELQGVRIFLELGPQPTLCGLGAACRQGTGSRFIPSLKTIGMDWEQLLQSLAELYCAGATPDWTGFQRGWSGQRLTLPTYPFQRERYWVEGEDDPSVLSRAFYQISWNALAAAPPLSQAAQPTLDEYLVMFGEPTTFCRDVFEACREQGRKNLWIQKSDQFCIDGDEIQLDPFSAGDAQRLIQSLEEDPSLQRLRIVFAWSLDGEEASVAGYLNLIRALAEVSCNVQLVLLTRHVAPLPGEWSAVVDPASSPFWGLGRTAELEHAKWSVTVLDLTEDPQEVQAAAREILSPAPVHQVALRGAHRFVPALRGVSLPDIFQLPFAIKSDAIYLITGGLGSLGLLSAAWLVEKGAHHLVLLGRQGLADAPESERGRGAPQRQAVQELEARGVRVDIVQADIADAERMQAILNQLQSEGALAGVIHAAGSLDTTPLHLLSLETYCDVTRGKLRGAQVLHDLTRQVELDFMLFYSSVAALWGSPNMGHYAAANAYLDALAHHRTALGLPTLSVNWGAWENSTMTNQLRHNPVFQQSGLKVLPQRYAVRILDRALSQSNRAQTVCARYDWNRLITMLELQGPRHLFDDLRQERDAGAEAPTSSAGVSRGALRAMLDSAELEQREEVLLDYLRDRVRQSGKFRDASAVSLTTGFVDLGLDSLMMMTLKSDLERDLALTLRSTVTFDYPNLLVLCRYLLGQLEEASAAVATTPSWQQANETTQEIRPQPDDLSLDEIKSRLQDLLD